MKLSVIIPVYNEQKTLAEIVQKVLETPFEKEVILVDDGSTDQSPEILKQLAVDHDEIRVFSQAFNQGKGAALKRGFEAATGDVIIIQDADLEYDPADYGKLIQPITDGKADVVYGSRFIGELHRVHLYWHYLGNRCLTMLSNMLTNLNLTDMETCYKAFHKDVVGKLTIESRGFEVEPELTAKIARMHFRIYEVGISYAGRDYAEGKKITWKDGFRAIWAIIKFNLFRRT